MSNSIGNTTKILLIREYLLENTDSEHDVTVPDIINMLSKNSLSAERKAIYTYLKTLRDEYGLDIVSRRGHYSIVSREFELEEIKILADMVVSSNFITEKKTSELISKLKGQVSKYQSESIGRRIYVRNRIKSKNESVYLNVDSISEALNLNRKVEFKYFRYNVKKQKELRHNGKVHIVSPFALLYIDQNYYMLGFDDNYNDIRHYRVDRMTAIKVSKNSRVGHDVFEKVDITTYTNKVFYMFTGKEQSVLLRCRNYVVDAIIDRFGEDIIIIPDGDDFFTVRANIAVSPQFFAWISAFGTDIEIISPESVILEMHQHLKRITDMYSERLGI